MIYNVGKRQTDFSISCADPENFVRGGSALTSFFSFFLVNQGRAGLNTTISVPASARQRNAIRMAFRWRADDVPSLNAGLVAL